MLTNCWTGEKKKIPPENLPRSSGLTVPDISPYLKPRTVVLAASVRFAHVSLTLFLKKPPNTPLLILPLKP